MTLTKVTVSLKNIFASGQAYVALSRSRSLEGLEFDSFEPSVFKVEEKVLEWMAKVFPYNSLYNPANHPTRTLPVDLKIQKNQYSSQQEINLELSPVPNGFNALSTVKRKRESKFIPPRKKHKPIKQSEKKISVKDYYKKSSISKPKTEPILKNEFTKTKFHIKKEEEVIDLTQDEQITDNTSKTHILSKAEIKSYFETLSPTEQSELIIELVSLQSFQN